jgi:hypothetical protein
MDAATRALPNDLQEARGDAVADSGGGGEVTGGAEARRSQFVYVRSKERLVNFEAGYHESGSQLRRSVVVGRLSTRHRVRFEMIPRRVTRTGMRSQGHHCTQRIVVRVRIDGKIGHERADQRCGSQSGGRDDQRLDPSPMVVQVFEREYDMPTVISEDSMLTQSLECESRGCCHWIRSLLMATASRARTRLTPKRLHHIGFHTTKLSLISWKLTSIRSVSAARSFSR